MGNLLMNGEQIRTEMDRYLWLEDQCRVVDSFELNEPLCELREKMEALRHTCAKVTGHHFIDGKCEYCDAPDTI